MSASEMRIDLEHVWKSYQGEPVFQDLCLSFQGHSAYCLMAPSGTGKTTLFRLLMGLEAPDQGKVRFFPKESPRIGAVFQEDRLLEALSVVQNIRFVVGNRYSPQELSAFALRLLPEEALHKPVYEFSGGMRRRAAILRAILAPSDFVLMDEPFTGLDPASKQAAAAMIREHCHGKLLILSTHSPEDARLFHAQIVRLGEKSGQ